MKNNNQPLDLSRFGMSMFLIFLTLKLTNTVNWSWVWVFAPLWVPVLFLILCVVILAIVDYPRTDEKEEEE